MGKTLSTLSFTELAATCTLAACFPPLLLYATHRYRNRELYKIPGLYDWPIVGDVLHLSPNPAEFYQQMLLLFEEHRAKKILRFMIGTRISVVFFNADNIEKILSSSVNIEKANGYEIGHEWLGLGLLMSGGDKWRSRRKMLTPSFHFNILQDFLVTMNEHSLSLKEKLEEVSVDGKPFDIFHYISLNSLDIICETAMGVKLNSLLDQGSDYVEAVVNIKDIIGRRDKMPLLKPDFIFYMFPMGWKYAKSLKILHNFTIDVIKKRIEDRHGELKERKYKAFLDMLLDCTDEHGNLLTINDIREEVDTFMFEGHDTVSAALGFAVHLLGAHPTIQQRCAAELDNIFDSPRSVEMNDLRKMVYLEACIKETLRLFPSVPFFARRLTNSIKCGEYTLPKDTNVMVFTSTLHRDPEYFPEPKRFDPERFLGEQAHARHPYAYVPFSAGPRNCIGQRFAMMELKVVLSVILRNFTIHSTQKTQDIHPNPGMVLQPTDGIMVCLTPRA